jgi:HSP20 family protein
VLKRIIAYQLHDHAQSHFYGVGVLDHMSEHDLDFLVWPRVNDLLKQAERIHQNFLQIAAGARYGTSHGRTPSWEPPVNVVEIDESLWVISALAGVEADRVEVRLDGCELVIAGERPLPACCNDGELKIWEIPLGRFERRLRLVGHESPLSLGEISVQNGLLIIELRKHS